MYGFGPLGGLVSLVFWIIVIVLIIGWLRPHRPWHEDYQDHGNDRITPADILSERFAKGEIDEKEYKERMEVLKKHSK